MSVIDSIKGAIKSWTIWFNSVVAAFIMFLPEIQASLPQLAAYLPANVYKWLALAVLLTNLALRFKTTKALADK